MTDHHTPDEDSGQAVLWRFGQQMTLDGDAVGYQTMADRPEPQGWPDTEFPERSYDDRSMFGEGQ